MQLDRQRIAVTVLCGAGGHPDPALADTIFLDIGLLRALEADADVARQHLGIVVWTRGVGRQPVRQGIGRGFSLLVHSSASISLRKPSGLAVGACRATTLPARST